MGTRQGPWEWMCNCCSDVCNCCSDVCNCCKPLCRCNCFRKCCRKICPTERLCACCSEICPCNCAAGLCAQNPDWLQPDEVSAEDYIDQKPREVKARVTWDGPVNLMLRSCGGFATGAILTILYAAIVLFVKNYNLWYCIATSLAFGCFLCLGMAFSVTIRMNVLLMLPQLFSGEGKATVLLVAFTLAVQGPGANILENFHRSTESVSCGVELATNQTKELYEKVKRPLVNALNLLKNIGRKLKGAADKAKRFFKTIMGSAKHAARSLLRVWRFIANMGEICNEELEGPYKKCNKLFNEAKDNCLKVMSFLGFLCYILEIFRPLCGLAKIILIFCLLPYYVQRFVKNNLKNPIVNTIRKIKDSFDFNITVNHRFDVTLNSSKTVMDVASGIMKEVQRTINPYLDVLSIFSYSMTFVCIYLYITADRYRRNYLYEDNHDNIYITRKFIELDVMRAKQGRNTLLPLSTWEAYRFIRPGSLYLTRREMQGYSFAIINVFRNLLIVVFMVLVDYLVFWILDMVHHLLQGDIVARAPTTVFVAVNGSGLIREIYTSVVSAFDIIQGANLSVLSQKCLVLPAEPDFRGYLVLGAMYGLAFFITIFGVYVQRLNRTICASYHPSREQERICFLYNNLATKRLRIESALIKSVKMKAEDKGHTNILFILAAKLPAFQWLLRLLGSTEQYCMGCAVVVSGTSGLDYLPCVTTGCKGLYCKGCFELLNNVCAICMAPLAYSEAMDEEIDSSDEEAVHMYIEAMKSLRAKEKEKRRKMRVFLKDRLRQFIRSQGGDGVRSQMLLQKYRAKARKRESSSETSETETSEDSGETDYEYQDKSEDSDKSDTEAVSPSWKPKKNTNLVYTNE